MRSSRDNWTFSNEHPVYKCLPEYEVVSNLIVDYYLLDLRPIVTRVT